MLYGGRVSKNNPHTEAYGITDEAVSAMGLARALSTDTRVQDTLRDLQRDLYPVTQLEVGGHARGGPATDLDVAEESLSRRTLAHRGRAPRQYVRLGIREFRDQIRVPEGDHDVGDPLAGELVHELHGGLVRADRKPTMS
ncbi:MAG: ATP:cob(I)alamin adenosyltransferase [Gemmatimonadetes bacterium]|nr:ATP:cob(I)alamin adenosyltransferase [Gemmatimonadota bacterium]